MFDKVHNPPELASSDSASLLKSFGSLVRYWSELDPLVPLQGDEGFSIKPDQDYLEISPREFREFWQIARSFPEAGLVGLGDEVLCSRPYGDSRFDAGHVHLTENTICTTAIGARSVGGRWHVARLSAGNVEDSPLSVGEYLVSFGLMQLCQEPGKFNGTWNQVDNIKQLSEILQDGSRCIWEADLWGARLRVSFHESGILWYHMDNEISVSARNAATYAWINNQWF